MADPDNELIALTLKRYDVAAAGILRVGTRLAALVGLRRRDQQDNAPNETLSRQTSPPG